MTSPFGLLIVEYGVEYRAVSGLDTLVGPIAGPDELADLASLVAMFLGLLRSAIDVPQVVPMALNHFHDVGVGLDHVDSFEVLGGSNF